MLRSYVNLRKKLVIPDSSNLHYHQNKVDMGMVSVSYFKQIIRVHGLITVLYVKKWFKEEVEDYNMCRLIDSAVIETNANYPLELTETLLEHTRKQCIREGHGEDYVLDKINRAAEVISEINGETKTEFLKMMRQAEDYELLFDSLVSEVIARLSVSKSQAEKRVTALMDSGIFEDPTLTESARKKRFISYLETQID